MQLKNRAPENLESPSGDAVAVTPSDVTDFDNTARMVYVGTTGDVTAVMAADSAAITFVGVPAGTFLPIQCNRINSTGTSASNIVALF